MTDESLRALPRDVPDYHARQAAHLRALAVNAATTRLKARLLDQAEQHDRLAARLKSPTEPGPPCRKRNATSPM
jgi:hypothetical protein